jgi:hypothetical protein
LNRPGRPVRGLGDELRTIADRVVLERHGERWPSPRWQADPVGFARTILGVVLWSFQVDFLEAIRDHRHVSVAGGRKIGKDFAVAVACLWWWASFPRARVLLLAPTGKQLDGIAYREIRSLFYASGRCVDCKRDDPRGPRPCVHSAVLAGSVSLLARNGIKAPDLREIIGQTAIAEGGLRGYSGGRVLAVEDEAADIKDEFDTALVGNLAGADCHRVMISNPTKTTGFFFRSHHEERDLFKTMIVSTETNPNIVEGRDVFSGLADRQWLRERELAWGRGSMLWAANVEGRFPKAEEGQLFTLEALTLACSPDRYAAADATGRLQLGIDVAGEGQEGDETAFAVRRGMRQLEPIHTQRGLSPDAILNLARSILNRHRGPDDALEEQRPIVCLDRDGGVGARCFDVFNAYVHRNDETEREFKLIGFQGGQPPQGRLAGAYRWNRDAMFAGLVEWLKMGGALLPDLRLEAELVSVRWKDVEGGKSALEHKSAIKERLGRSPDRADSLALATYTPSGWYRPATLDAPERAPGPERGERDAFDPYRARIAETFDPFSTGSYGGEGRRR